MNFFGSPSYRACTLGLFVLVWSRATIAHAQQVPAPDVAPAPAATPAASSVAAEPDDWRTELRAMRERMAAQEQEIQQQRAEIAALQAQAAESTDTNALLDSASADAEVQEIAEGEWLRFYGFMDVGLQKVWGGVMDTGLAPSDANTFVLGNVNLYLDATPAPNWRSLVEVRFTNLPDGADSFDGPSGQTTRQVTAVQDTSAAHGGLTDIHLNGIILERAHIDYSANNWLNVRGGVFLTPYGIWNVDHGAPVRIMPRPPGFVSARLIPERQTGVEVFGTINLLPWSLEYHAYVSNGRTLGTTDFDEDKAIGGRLVLGTRRPIGFRVGASFFTGSSEDVRTTPGVTDAGELGLVKVEQVAYDEVAGAGDVALDIDSLRIRSEFVVLRRIYEPGKRDSFGGFPTPDTVQTGGYFLAAYELPWYRVEPYGVVELIRVPVPGIADGFAAAGGGLNIYFTPTTQLRLFYMHTWCIALDGPDPENFQIESLGSRVVVAF